MVRHLLFAVACAPALASTTHAQSPPRSVTLTEAIALSQKADPNVIKAFGDTRNASADTRIRYGSFLPQVSGNVGGGRSFSEFQRVDPRTGQLVGANSATNSLSLQLAASVDLFTGFRRGAELSASKAEAARADAALDAQKWQTAFTTARSFFDALQNRVLVRVRRDGIRRSEEQLAVAVARLTTRGSTISDSLQSVVAVSQARLLLLNQQSLLAQAEAALARAIGVDGRVAATDDSTLTIRSIPVDTSALLAEAKQRSPGVLQAEAAVRSAKASLTAARSSYYPQISLAANTSYGGNDLDPNNKYKLFNNRNLGVNVALPIFNGFQREQTMVNRAVAVDVARANADDARRQVESQLIGALAALEAAQERVTVSQAALSAAQANARVQVERYRLGTIQVEQLVQAEDRLSQAEEGAVTARFDYLRAKAQIEALIGRNL